MDFELLLSPSAFFETEKDIIFKPFKGKIHPHAITMFCSSEITTEMIFLA